MRTHHKRTDEALTAASARESRRWSRWRWIVWATLGMVVTGLVSGVWLLTAYAPPPTQLELKGSANELGVAHGREMRRRLSLIVDLYLHDRVCGGDQAVIEQRRAAAEALTAHWLPVYQEELVGMAEGSGVPLADLAYGNLFLDMGHAYGGCRSMVVRDEDVLLHAHNLDWSTLGGMAKWSTAVTRRQPDDGRFRTVAVGFPGLVGALDIINEHGLALSFNQLGHGGGEVSEPVFLAMRRLAEHCRTFAEAEAELRALSPGMPFIITLSSAAEGQGAVFERQRGEVTKRPLKDGWVAAANQAQAEVRGQTLIDRVCQQAAPTTVDAVKATLRHDDVLMGNNLYSVIFDYGRNRLYLASGQIPAAPGRYREFILFP